MARKQKTDRTIEVKATEIAPDVTTSEGVAPAKRSKRRASERFDDTIVTAETAAPAPTLADAFAGYLRSLEADGKSIGTISSYRAELVMAGNALGVGTPLTEIAPEQVLAFFTSDQVMRKRNGRAKSPLSIDKTRRVLRQALVWAEAARLVAVAPVPEMASHCSRVHQDAGRG
jgi:hypothetical protein